MYITELLRTTENSKDSLRKGYKFYTETDTEVLVNFIELCISNSKNVDKGLSYALSKLEELWNSLNSEIK